MQERLQTILGNQQRVYKKIEDTYATKEEIEKIENDYVTKKEIETGNLITSITEQHNNIKLGFWVGTTAEYNALPTKPDNCYVILTDDNTLEKLSVDYIVERATSGIWTYEKWASGIAKCWGRIDGNIDTMTTEWGNLYVKNNPFDRVNYPFEFIERPIENAIISTTQNAVSTFVESGGLGINTTTETAKYNAFRPTSVETEVEFSIVYDVKGRWKQEGEE